MEPTQVLTAVNTAFSLYEKARGLLKDLTRKLPDGASKQEANKDLVQADEAMQLARVELAKGLGFPLCQRHFPPGIKLDIREDSIPCWKCSECGDISPHKQNQQPRRGGFVKYY